MRTWGESSCGPVSAVHDPLSWTADARIDLTVPAHHNRWRVSVGPAATVVSGDVAVRPRVRYGDGQAAYVDGQAATVAYSASGGEASGSWAPGDGRLLRLDLTGYAGAGAVVVQLETWREPW